MRVGGVHKLGNGPWMMTVPVVNSNGFYYCTREIELPGEICKWYDASLRAHMTGEATRETGIERYWREQGEQGL